jgi:cytochrome c peroxidase
MGASGFSQPGAYSGADIAQCGQRPNPDFMKAYAHNGCFTSLKAIVHFYNTSDLLPRRQFMTLVKARMLAGTGVDWQHEQKPVGNLGLSGAEEDAIVSFMQTLTDGFMPVA